VRADEPKQAKTADAKPATLTVSILTGGAADDLKVLRETLEKIPGIKFKADDLKYADFGKEGGKFTQFLSIEIVDIAKTDIGAIAKAVSAANTSKKDKCPSALFLIVRYKAGTVKNEQFKTALVKVKGVQAEKSWVGDANLWLSVDGSGDGKLAEVTKALHAAEIKFKDPLTDNTDP